MDSRTVSGTNQAREARQGMPLKYIAWAAVAAMALSVGVTAISRSEPGMVEKLAGCDYSVTRDVNLGNNLRLSGHGLEAIMQVGADGRIGPDTPVQVERAEGALANLFYPERVAPAGAVLESAIASGQCPPEAYKGGR